MALYFVAPDGGDSLSFSSFGFAFAGFEVLLPGTLCTISADVTATAIGTHVSTSSAVTLNGPTIAPFSATLTVTGSELLLTKAFTNDPVAPGQSVNIDYEIRNTDRSVSVTNCLTSAPMSQIWV